MNTQAKAPQTQTPARLSRSLSLSPALSIVEGKCRRRPLASILAALCLAWGGQVRAGVFS